MPILVASSVIAIVIAVLTIILRITLVIETDTDQAAIATDATP